MIKYPANDVTPHGWHQIRKGQQPMLRLKAYDESIDFHLMGGLSIPDRVTAPECVQVPPDGLKGLIPPWRHIDQKGATQDGITHIDALYEPIEVELTAVCRGRDPKHTRRVVRDLIASIDAKQQSELGWLSHDLGYWWANVRWFKGAPPDPLAAHTAQKLSLRLRADTGFWKSYDNSDQFGFIYDSMSDQFDDDHAEDLGEDWPVYFYEEGEAAAGFPHTSDGYVVWSESGTTERATVMGPFKDFDTDTDDQVIEIQLGKIPEIFFPQGCFNDIWGRMGRDVNGDWDGNGVRARIGLDGIFGWVELSRFNNFVETTMFDRHVFFSPQRGDKFALVCGTEGDHRMFRITRNGLTVLSHKETGTGSLIGSNYRGVGFGMKAGAAWFLSSSQVSPAWVTKVSAGDNNTVSQSGFLKRTNIGDQPMYDDYICFGPGTFRIYNGPGSDEYVEFGKLLPNQVVLLRTDPRDRNVYDLTTIPPTPQELTIFQQALKQFFSFAFANNVPPLVQAIQSLFGILPPQGNIYSLLSGRFSDAAAIPPKSPGNPATPYHVKCHIVEGNADSRIIATGTPLRRYPL